MSSWLSISLPNPFKTDDDQTPDNPTPSPSGTGGGVKEDLSVLGQTIGRQLRGVAAFLAPPPPGSSPAAESSSQALLGIRNDLVEIGGSFKSSLSLLSSKRAVSEISRFASNLLPFHNDGNEVEGDEEDEEEAYEVAGVTDDVIGFVEEISLRPECWTDFPLSLDDDDFNMSDAQIEHASTVERLVPSLADLRHKSCNDLSEEKFWMIYFIFLLPRLHEQDAKLLGSPEIVEAREVLLQNLRSRRNGLVETSEESEEGVDDNNKQEGGPSRGQEVLVETSSSKQGEEIDHANTYQWSGEEDDADACTTSADAKKQPENEEEISFSDLEDNENDNNDPSGRLSRFRQARGERVPSPSGSNEWVRLSENTGTQESGGQKTGQSTCQEKDSEGEESNDWLTVDEVDLDNLAVV